LFWWFRVHLITAICKVHIEHGWRHTVVYVSYIMFSWMTYLLPRKKFLKLNFNLFYFQHKTYLHLSQNVLRLDLKNCKDFSQNNVQMKKKLVTVTLLAHFSVLNAYCLISLPNCWPCRNMHTVSLVQKGYSPQLYSSVYWLIECQKLWVYKILAYRIRRWFHFWLFTKRWNWKNIYLEIHTA
jgi:hypothetical protein